jgi:hypothetical protein
MFYVFRIRGNSRINRGRYYLFLVEYNLSIRFEIKSVSQAFEFFEAEEADREAPKVSFQNP